MNATISVVCYKSKTLSNGEHPLMLRICKDGKKKYQSLGLSIKATLGTSLKKSLSLTALTKSIFKKLSWINNENFNSEC